MEGKKITIGREADNTIQVNKSDVSGHHVSITQTGKNSFFVEDLGSTNYTFVNGSPVTSATIGVDDKLRLSKDTVINLREIFQIHSASGEAAAQSIYIEQFLKLKELWEETERQKKQVQRRHQRKAAFIRTGIMLLIIAIALPFRAILGDVFLAVSIAAGGIAGILVPVSPPEVLRTLDERLQLHYVCPFCETRLGQFSWNFYAEKGKCPNPKCDKSFKK